MAEGWPVVLTGVGRDPTTPVRLRPLTKRDGAAWVALRQRNDSWLRPWDATSPYPAQYPAANFAGYVRQLEREAKDGTMLPFAIVIGERVVGQLTVSSITRGSIWSGVIGYWISQDFAGRGIVPTAVALATDYCFHVLGLHRMEINIRPENKPSLRVVAKLGFHDEGMRRRYIHINGQWADHRSFALLAEDVPDGLLARWRAGANDAHRQAF